MGADILLIQKDSDITLTFTEKGNRRPACLNNLYVYEGANFDKPVLQYTAPFGYTAPCLSKVTLGARPTGSGDDVPPPLHFAPGHRYVVAANGTGWRADTDFVAAR